MPRRHPRPAPRRGRAETPPPDIAARDASRRQACAAKVRYDSEAQARSYALMHTPGRGPRASVYRCDVCDGWHLTRG